MAETEARAAGSHVQASDVSKEADAKAKRRPRNRSGKAAKKEAEAKANNDGKPVNDAGESKARTTKRKKSKQKKSKKDKSAEGDGRADAIPKVKLKVVVRRLPPNLPEEVFWKAVSPWATREKGEAGSTPHPNASSHLDTMIEQGYFVPGKLKDASRRQGVARNGAGVLHTLSRAYMRFKSIEALINFHKGFDGHLFRDAKGNEHIAVVEFAPYQRMPNDVGKRKRPDALVGTIEADSDFKAFVESLTTKETGNGEQMSAEKTDAQLMAHLTSLHEANQLNKEARSTPLLDHLRRQRTAKAEAAALKQAKKYLNKSHGAYAAASSAANTSEAAARKGKGKQKDKQAAVKGQQIDPAIPTGPKALRTAKEKQGAGKGAVADKERSASGDSKKKGSEKAATKGIAGAQRGSKGPAAQTAGYTSTVEAVTPNADPSKSASVATNKPPRAPRRSKGPKGGQHTGQSKSTSSQS